MLKAIVEEMNRFGETPLDSLKYLNVKPEYNRSYMFKVQCKVGAIDVTDLLLQYKEYKFNPLSSGYADGIQLDSLAKKINLKLQKVIKKDEYIEIEVGPDDLIETNMFDKIFKYRVSINIQDNVVVFDLTFTEKSELFFPRYNMIDDGVELAASSNLAECL